MPIAWRAWFAFPCHIALLRLEQAMSDCRVL